LSTEEYEEYWVVLDRSRRALEPLVERSRQYLRDLQKILRLNWRRQAAGRRVLNARLQQATGAAAATILKLMVDPTVPASVRTRASECVLNHANKTIEIEDIDVRVAALEEAAQKTGPKTRKTISSRGLRKTGVWGLLFPAER
jgi:hypothetical protein